MIELNKPMVMAVGIVYCIKRTKLNKGSTGIRLKCEAPRTKQRPIVGDTISFATTIAMTTLAFIFVEPKPEMAK